MTKKITATIMGIAMMAAMFTGCSEKAATTEETVASTLESVTNHENVTTVTESKTEAATEVTTMEIKKAPVTLYEDFANEVLNDAPTTLPDDGFYYKAFTSIAADENMVALNAWANIFNSEIVYSDLTGISADVYYDGAIITDTESFMEHRKNEHIDNADFWGEPVFMTDDDYARAKEKIDVDAWMDFCEEFLGGAIPLDQGYNDTYNYEKLDAEVKPQILAIADAWLEANFMGIPIPEELTTEDFRACIDTDAAYAYFASKGALPYMIDNNGSTKESYEACGVTDTRELFVSDKVSIWSKYDYTNFVMYCNSRIYFETEDGKTDSSPIRFVIVVKPEKNAEGSWNFKLDYASFDEYIDPMDKFGTYNEPKAYFDIVEYSTYSRLSEAGYIRKAPVEE